MAEIAFLVDLSRLPPHAIVAYAVRCAMRVEPLWQRANLGAEQVASLTQARQLAERLVSGQVLSDEDALAADEAEVAAQAAVHTPATHYAARAAVFAARAASAADRAPYAAATFGGDAARAARAAVVAAVSPEAAEDAAHYADYAAQADYERLVLYNRGGPPLGQPLHCGEDGPLGPLWPEGKPSWLEMS